MAVPFLMLPFRGIRLRLRWESGVRRHTLAPLVMWLIAAMAPAYGQSETGRTGSGVTLEVPATTKQLGIDFFELLVSGGVFMIPIGITSLVVVTFIFDRWIGLRASKLLPTEFRKSLTTLLRSGTVDPRQLYRLCNESPSAAATIAREAVVRAGRPQPEVAAAVAEVAQRQADRAYSNVRWLNLGAGIAPLLGLLGTVWGLIRAFHDTTQLTAGQNRADFLAVGIYEALVTTLAGLIVAIPAAVASHYFEGKITRVFARIEELTSELVRGLEPYEGKTRFDVIGRDLSPRDIAPPSHANSNAIVAPPISKRIELRGN